MAHVVMKTPRPPFEQATWRAVVNEARANKLLRAGGDDKNVLTSFGVVYDCTASGRCLFLGQLFPLMAGGDLAAARR